MLRRWAFLPPAAADVNTRRSTINSAKTCAYEEGYVKLSDEAAHIEDEANPASGNAEHGRIRQLVKAVALHLPRASEADMSKADRAPDTKTKSTTDQRHLWILTRN